MWFGATCLSHPPPLLRSSFFCHFSLFSCNVSISSFDRLGREARHLGDPHPRHRHERPRPVETSPLTEREGCVGVKLRNRACLQSFCDSPAWSALTSCDLVCSGVSCAEHAAPKLWRDLQLYGRRSACLAHLSRCWQRYLSAKLRPSAKGAECCEAVTAAPRPWRVP